ncbi:MAG: hypothetical protein WC712_06355 [Candidatus Brocadiia bacterium]
MAPRWYFNALLTDGRLVTSKDDPSSSIPWLSLREAVSAGGPTIAVLALRKEDDPDFSIELPPVGRYFHLKRARCEFRSPSEPLTFFGLGFEADGGAVFVWGGPDGRVSMELRNDLASISPAAIPAP